MIKKTLYFGNTAVLRIKDRQLRIIRPEHDDVTVPLEDIGVIMLDHYGISVSHGVLSSCMEYKIALINTNERHMPAGLLMPLSGNVEQGERFIAQTGVGQALKNNLWQQIIKAKIRNQAGILKQLNLPYEPLIKMSKEVMTRDRTNRESLAARFYWENLFHPSEFRRNREGKPPNNLLNFGYAILRAVVARSLISTGLLPTLGIFHRNRYNAFPLADDIMEPFRPFVDIVVRELAEEELELSRIDNNIRNRLLEIQAMPVLMEKEVRPLMLAADRTCSSLMQCFKGLRKKLVCPEV
ncbi:MAG: type II CRISPR-associated endonuclease Cas1 [Calditrichaceae bacterium]